MIDTSSEKGEWTEADKIVHKIISEDEDIDQHISAYDIIN